MNYALVNKETGVIENLIELAEEHNYVPAEHLKLAKVPKDLHTNIGLKEVDGVLEEVSSELHPSQILGELDIRLARGFETSINGSDPYVFKARDADLAAWSEITEYADILNEEGVEPVSIDVANVLLSGSTLLLNHTQIKTVRRQLVVFRQQLKQKSLAIIQMKPIPEDYFENSYWN